LPSALVAPRPTTAYIWFRALLLVAAGVVGLGMLLGNAEAGPLTVGTVLQVLVGLSFVACGVFVWARRPTGRLGPLMTMVGMLWLVGRTLALVANPVVYPVGLWLTDLWAPAFALFLLSFPTGRLASRADLAIVGVYLFVTVPLELLWFLFLVPANGLNAFALAPDPSAAHVVDTIQRDLISLSSVLLVIALGQRWLRSSSPVQRQLIPVLVGGVAIMLQSVSWIFLSSGQSLEPLDDLIFVAQIAIPIAILAVILRTRMARGAVADLVVELGQAPTPARLRAALAQALGDPTLEVGYWAPGQNQFVDEAGTALELPEEGSDRSVTLLERNGVPDAALIHDAILLDEPGLVASVASAMRLAVENDRLTAAVEAQLDEVRASRARIVAAGDVERQRIERDLHDGAQQRLVALTLALRLARTKLGGDADPSVRMSLEQASEEAKSALAELRELARGIHPQILTSAGLHAAIEALASRTTTTVVVEIDPDIRFASTVETVAYFVVSESLANIAKHAEATSVHIRAAWQDGILTVEVADDGRGGADPMTGTGLRGLADRVSAVGGLLEVVSPLVAGTRILARIPSAAPTHTADRPIVEPAP
jgi:signal transduction histidine kinase